VALPPEGGKMMGEGLGVGFGVGLPGIGMLLVWGALILLLVGVVRAFQVRSSSGTKSVRQILDERFARGEIDRQEYADKKRLLG
jgi:putative membrane protein